MKTPGLRYAWYATAVLMIAYTFSFLDRQILNLMVGPIERDLGISDSQFALLTGGAFGIFYTVMGLPLGWLADRLSRKWIVSAGITCWSLMTAACGVAGSFTQLMLTRIGVGVGEATLSPSAYSMLADYFDKARLPRAMSVYTCGIFIGAGTAMMLGGAVVSAVQNNPAIHLAAFGVTHSWQLVFVIVGLPGLLLALWLATLREPVRRDHGADSESVARVSEGFAQGMRELGAFLVRYPRMCIALFLGSAFFSILGYTDTWYPELFIRTWGWTPSQSGLVNGASSLIAGPLGLLFAGWYSSHLIARGRVDACLRLTACGAIGITLPAVIMPLAPNAALMALCLLPLKFFVGFPPVLIPSAIQMVAPNRLRGQLGALFLFTVGIIGVSLGPLLPALFNDYVFKNHDLLRYSIAWSTGLVGPIACGTLWLGVRQYTDRFHEMESAANA
ncbi:MAG TPA: MFS transporter [Steroidobacteraceae bacterium]|nr:MFS transporter [Steroidobacteraceae bacterium]